MKILTRTVILLSLVSLLTDISSEMLYPILPIYLKSIGFSAVFIGILEGIAEAASGLSKGYFGSLSDKLGKRLPFVQIGYGLSSLAKPMMAIFTFQGWIFLARTLDRLGKGIRTAPRDALLNQESTPENKGKVFGFHRGADSFGAAIGPFIALGFLYFYPESYRELLLLAFIPAVIGVAVSFFINSKKSETKSNEIKALSQFIKYYPKSPIAYKKTVLGLLLFGLFNSSDFFLLLMIKEKLGDDSYVLFIYIFFNLIYSLLSYPLGGIADKYGFKRTFSTGLILFACVYSSMSINDSLVGYFIIFLFYGAFMAATEGVSKAWLSSLVEKSEAGTALGTYASLASLTTLIASSLAGVIWSLFGPEYVFLFAGIGALGAWGYFSMGYKTTI